MDLYDNEVFFMRERIDNCSLRFRMEMAQVSRPRYLVDRIDCGGGAASNISDL